ncbi:MAG: hypothetical protein KC656_06730 [Myxococcales bacterium]|nr:hypothetical protein [Myxococcales bacterium]
MLSLLLAMSAADAATPSYKMSTPLAGTLDFKTCAAAADDTIYWWDQVAANIAAGAPSDVRSTGSCFDVDIVTPNPEGQAWLESLGLDYAKLNLARFERTSSTGETIILSSEGQEPTDYDLPEWHPAGPGLIDVYKHGQHAATVETMGVGVNHITITDVDLNGMNDFLMVMENGEIWQAMNVMPGDFVFHTGQTLFFNY